jgi:hypothetical protein
MYLTACPPGGSVPIAATLNAAGGNVVGSAALVLAANTATGDISVYSSVATELIIDINGYFAP